MLTVYLAVGGLVGVVILLMLSRIARSTHGTTVQDKVVLITGASSGLGEACAEVFFRAGAKVILFSRNSEKLEATSKRLQTLNVPEVTYSPVIVPLDLEDLDSLSDKAEQAVQCHGRVDILINNAGLGYRGTCLDTTTAVHQKVMIINYFGPITLTRGIIQNMVQNGGGHVVNISSVQGRMAIPHRSAYAAAKHALQAYSDTLRAEMASKGVKVTVLWTPPQPVAWHLTQLLRRFFKQWKGGTMNSSWPSLLTGLQ
ncbi:dehydrogenase/reductase SDR family protein 7-like isoform X2 [Branchiostoma floridae]|uniref:Dehydrogenase/reductase SDR family member 7B n=1 Tax=Branchiostoma floridae TaxID=7739 RepID=A0A9J7N9K5_BRAFL|nr:dehydrogenase/reductase SDR family protein 7-like isoform X2 [Branchiostoma floridae]